MTKAEMEKQIQNLQKTVDEQQEKVKKQLAYNRAYREKNYKRVEICIKPDVYEKIVDAYGDDVKLASYIKKLIQDDLDSKN